MPGHTSRLRRRIPELATVLMFGAAIAVPGAMTIATSSGARVDPIEKRTLAARPGMPRSLRQLRDFPTAFDEYFNDRLVTRRAFVRANARAVYALGGSTSPDVVVADDGWLFLSGTRYGDPIGDSLGRNRYTPAQLRVLAQRMEQRRRWLQRRGIAFVVVVSPNKATMYRDRLPTAYEPTGQPTAMSQLIDTLRDSTDVTVVDLRPALRRARAQSRFETYHKTDSHWNDFGAAVAQHEIIRTVADATGGGLAPLAFSDSDFELARDDDGGDLAAILGLADLLHERRPALTAGASRRLCVTTTTRPAGRKPYTTSCPDAGARALIFHDSFYTALQPYVSSYFESATHLWTRMEYGPTSHHVQVLQPHVVIEQFVERKLPRVPRDDARWSG